MQHVLNSHTVASEFIVKVYTGNLNFMCDLLPQFFLSGYKFDNTVCDNTFTWNILRLLRLV